jgi:hypothetical protein
MEVKMKKTTALFVLVGMALTNVNTYGLALDFQEDQIDPTWVLKLRDHPQYPIEDVKSFSEFLAEANAEGEAYGALLQAIRDRDYDAVVPTVLNLEKLTPCNRYSFLGASWCGSTTNCQSEEKLEMQRICYENHENREASEWVSDILYRLVLDACRGRKGSDDNEIDERLYVSHLYRRLRYIICPGKMRNYINAHRVRGQHNPRGRYLRNLERALGILNSDESDDC